MKAIVYHKYGPPKVLQVREVKCPVSGKEGVLVRVRASSVTAGDWRLRRADPFIIRCVNGPFHPMRKTILGMEMAGDVIETGKGVNRLKAGDRVFGTTGFRQGGYAQYVCLQEK